jgi:hypothetical protein
MSSIWLDKSGRTLTSVARAVYACVASRAREARVSLDRILSGPRLMCLKVGSYGLLVPVGYGFWGGLVLADIKLW